MIRFRLVQRCLNLAVLAAAVPSGLAGQTAQGNVTSGPAAAFLAGYNEVVHLAPVPTQVADVHHLVLQRDAARLTLEQGKLYLLSPVGGRTVGAVFQGSGRVELTPTLAVERGAMRGFTHDTMLDDSLDEAILIFADSTPAQLRGLAFGPADVPGNVGGHVTSFLNTLKGTTNGSFDASTMGPLLNADTGGFFLARVERRHGDAVLFELDPAASEEVQLYRLESHLMLHNRWMLVTAFPARGQPVSPPDWRGPRDRLRLPHYAIDVRVNEEINADLSIAAAATLTLVPRERVGPWLDFKLHPKVTLDSARWSDGTPAPAFKAEDDDDGWVRAARPLRPGDSLALTLYYHGDVFGRALNWFLIPPGEAWFPFNGQGSTVATFDLTYHSPSQYTLISVGERGDTAAESPRVRRSHWIQREPTDQATFNVGLFDPYHAAYPGAPAVDVLISEAAHRQIRQLTRGAVIEQSHQSEAIAADVSNSLKLYTTWFGTSGHDHFYVTEIPYDEGVSFPGMIDLSASTFLTTSLNGADEWFRAHEAAHQWWGNGVRAATYRDVWLSEGLASFSALWYLQVERRHSDEYFAFLDRWRGDIRGAPDDAGPIWLGHRSSAYETMVYEKGAWVFNMLRVLMLDLRTMSDDRFKAMMQDYYLSFYGRPATTADFQGVVERHLGMPMDWFFDEWVRGIAIPTYHVRWKNEPADGGRFRIRLRITQEHVPAGFRMPVLVAADLGNDRIAHFRVDVHGADGEYTSPPLPAEAQSVTFNDLHAVLADVKMDGGL